jgi:hypothetical protein
LLSLTPSASLPGWITTLQVIKETHEAYVHLKSGARKNDEELSLM